MNKEDNLLLSVASYLRLQYPNVLFCHIANERKTSIQQGAKLKRLGVRAGMPDILIFQPNKTYSGLAIELKIKPNKPTKNQLEVLTMLSNNNWNTAVCYDFDEAKNLIDNHLNLN
jgi:hypothetical protein|nr:MAG TPA: Nuclease [Caudoviricetes sp.]